MENHLNLIGAIASIVSLVLAVVFWILASRQARNADSVLREVKSIQEEVKDKMLSWQGDINSAAINLIQARPEVIAQKVSLEEARSQAAFSDRLAAVAESLASELTEQTAGYKIAALKEILEHQRALALGGEKIKAGVIMAQAAAAGAPGRQP